MTDCMSQQRQGKLKLGDLHCHVPCQTGPKEEKGSRGPLVSDGQFTQRFGEGPGGGPIWQSEGRHMPHGGWPLLPWPTALVGFARKPARGQNQGNGRGNGAGGTGLTIWGGGVHRTRLGQKSQQIIPWGKMGGKQRCFYHLHPALFGYQPMGKGFTSEKKP